MKSRKSSIKKVTAEKIYLPDRNRLAEACVKLDPAFEKKIAEEGMGGELREKSKTTNRRHICARRKIS